MWQNKIYHQSYAIDQMKVCAWRSGWLAEVTYELNTRCPTVGKILPTCLLVISPIQERNNHKMAAGLINRFLRLFLIAAILNNILMDKTVLHGCKAFFSTIVDGLQADGLISTNFRNICYLHGDRVVIRKYCIETTNNNVGLIATANLTRFRSTNGTGKQVLCEEPLEFLGITQNIYGQEFDNDFSKNEIHICIILNTVERTQEQTYCFFHITWKSKTAVFLLLKLKRQKKPVPYYSNTSATQ